MEEKEIRINKFLSDGGICSRREADRLIESGLVTVDGKKALPGQKVTDRQFVCVKGTPIRKTEEKIYLLLNKPKGIVCTSQKREKNNIIDYLKYPVRLTYAGRLDKDSEGLMLMTNDGDLINRLMRARNAHEKEYIVTVSKPISDEFLQGMAQGVPIGDTVTRPCEVRRTGSNTLRIVLTQGLNRQIRRMCEYFGYEVQMLKRVRILNLRLGSLQAGKTRMVTAEELSQLNRLLRQEQTL